MMPKMSGLDVLARLRADAARASLPCIILTAAGQEQHHRQAMALGASDFLTKPFSPKKLYARVAELTGVPVEETGGDGGDEPLGGDPRRRRRLALLAAEHAVAAEAAPAARSPARRCSPRPRGASRRTVKSDRTLVITNASLAGAVAQLLPALPRSEHRRRAALGGHGARRWRGRRRRSCGATRRGRCSACTPTGRSATSRASAPRSTLAAEEAEKHHALLTVGVVPTRPDPGFGYIRVGAKVDAASRVEKFLEKPDRATAERLVREGCLWNSGIFVWRAADFLEEIRAHCPEVAPALPLAMRGELKAFFEQCTPISVDHGVLERSDRVMVLPGDFGWDDVGTWDALHRVRALDGGGERRGGRCASRRVEGERGARRRAHGGAVRRGGARRRGARRGDARDDAREGGGAQDAARRAAARGARPAMTELFLYDDARARSFEPFALTRPASELRVGAELVRRRWEMALGTVPTSSAAARRRSSRRISPISPRRARRGAATRSAARGRDRGEQPLRPVAGARGGDRDRGGVDERRPHRRGAPRRRRRRSRRFAGGDAALESLADARRAGGRDRRPLDRRGLGPHHDPPPGPARGHRPARADARLSPGGSGARARPARRVRRGGRDDRADGAVRRERGPGARARRRHRARLHAPRRPVLRGRRRADPRRPRAAAARSASGA